LNIIFVENKLIHFPCCEVIKQEFDNEFKFEHCITHIDELIVEFKRRFEEVELMRPQINYIYLLIILCQLKLKSKILHFN
jgi:hypothetical protein